MNSCRWSLTPHGPAADILYGWGRGRALRGSACKAFARDDKLHLQSGAQKGRPKPRDHSGLDQHNLIEMPCRRRQPRHYNDTKIQLCVLQWSPTTASPINSCASVQTPEFFPHANQIANDVFPRERISGKMRIAATIKILTCSRLLLNYYIWATNVLE